MPISSGVRRCLTSRWVTFLFLYLVQFGVVHSLVRAANSQHLLTKEEVSAGFASPLFAAFHLQHDLYATNFYSYLIFQWGHSIFPGLLGIRETKAAVMAALPGIICLLLRDRFSFPPVAALLFAFTIGMSPCLLGFSWLATEYGLESAIGFFALWLAFDEHPPAMCSSAVLAAVSAEAYGPGLTFLAPVLCMQAARLKIPRLRLTAAASIAAAFYFSRPAAPLAGVAIIALLLCALAPQVPGVRRAISCVAVLSIFANLAIHRLSLASHGILRLAAAALLACWLALSVTEIWTLRDGLRDAAIALPRDFSFAIPPRSTMEATIADFLSGRRPLPRDWTLYEPDRSLSILYNLSLPHPAISQTQLLAICETYGFAMSSNQPRLNWLRRRL